MRFRMREALRYPIRKDAGLYGGSRLRKGEVFAYVGRNPNLKDLKCSPVAAPASSLQSCLLGWEMRAAGLKIQMCDRGGPTYRVTSLTRTCPPPKGHHMSLGIVLL